MVHMRRLGIVIILICLAVGSYGWKAVSAATATLSPSSVAHLSPHLVDATGLDWPEKGQAALGALDYGTLETHGADTPLPTASTAKIMTALCVLQKYPLNTGESGPTITLTQKDQDIYNSYYRHNGSLAAIRVGEKITEYQALEAMLLPSANNMADTLAIWAYGSLDAYTSYANQYAQQLGMKHSHFAVDASGFNPSSVSTAADLTKLGLTAMKNPVLAGIVSKSTATIPVAGKVSNVNFMLGQDGIVGIKTGNNDQDKGAFLLAAKYDVTPTQSVTIVDAVMGSDNLINAMQAAERMLLSAEQNFQEVTYASAGQTVGHYHVPWAKADVEAVVAKDLKVVIWDDRSASFTPKVQLLPVTAPAFARRRVGNVSVKLPEGKQITTPVILKSQVNAPSLTWRLAHP